MYGFRPSYETSTYDYEHFIIRSLYFSASNMCRGHAIKAVKKHKSNRAPPLSECTPDVPKTKPWVKKVTAAAAH